MFANCIHEEWGSKVDNEGQPGDVWVGQGLETRSSVRVRSLLSQAYIKAEGPSKGMNGRGKEGSLRCEESSLNVWKTSYTGLH